MTDQSFLWYDYETFGTDPRRDWPAQFAAVRTDMDLQPVGDPMVLYCHPPRDRLPSPGACLLTGITPQECLQKGVPEHVFAQQINAAMSQPGTIVAGYNSIRFDDEVTRFLLWRNLLDPYAREWRDGCSRWDLLDVMRCAHALRPQGIEWPEGEDGKTSFRLEKLASANGIAHEQAHDALFDVHATIGLARLLRDRQPRLFDFCLALRDKHRVARELGLPTSLQQRKPFLHVSGMFGAERGCLAVMAPLAMQPGNRNAMLAWDLCEDPGELAGLDATQIRERLFTRTEDLPEGVQRLPIKAVHLNKSPVVISSLKTLTPEQAARWGVDLEQAQKNFEVLMGLPDLSAIWDQVYVRERHAEVDVDEDLYGAFVGDADRRRLDGLRKLSGEELAASCTGFDDGRLPDLLQRYRARNYPQTLSEAERADWQAHCAARLLEADTDGQVAVTRYFDEIDALQEQTEDERSAEILGALYAWAELLAGDLEPDQGLAAQAQS